jgi:hypothetical protein
MRIRTIKPELWSDPKIGRLSPHARLLFIATFNLVDDEGILRWNSQYLGASVFMYDDEMDAAAVNKVMDEITEMGLVFNYEDEDGEPLGFVVNFRKHQRIDKPGPSKFPPPPLDDPEVIRMYLARDESRCGECQTRIGSVADAEIVAVERKTKSNPATARRAQPAVDAPSMLVAMHTSCARRTGRLTAVPVEEAPTLPTAATGTSGRSELPAY